MSKEFEKRHIGSKNQDSQKMLDRIGADSLEDLILETVPSSIRLKEEMPISEGLVRLIF